MSRQGIGRRAGRPLGFHNIFAVGLLLRPASWASQTTRQQQREHSSVPSAIAAFAGIIAASARQKGMRSRRRAHRASKGEWGMGAEQRLSLLETLSARWEQLPPPRRCSWSRPRPRSGRRPARRTSSVALAPLRRRPRGGLARARRACGCSRSKPCSTFPRRVKSLAARTSSTRRVLRSLTL